jgi:hypothetical protein
MGARTVARWLARSLSVAALALVGGSLGACAETRVSLATGPREYVPSDYPQVLKT